MSSTAVGIASTDDRGVDGFTAAWQEWHAAQEARLADPHGFLAITSLHFLTAEPERFADAPGVWSTAAEGVLVRLDPEDRLEVDGVVITGEHRFDPIPERGGINAVWGDVVLEIARRGGYDILRPRHPDNDLRVAYHGTPAFAPDPRWAVTGRFVPFDEPRPTTVGASVEGLQHVYDAPGRVEFELSGETLGLTVFNGATPGSFMALFTDATSGVTTYAANRSVQIAAPDENGAVLIDFNRASNLPCAYTDLATCPLPPAGNRLPVAIEAGHRIPYERS
ncbi:DUF1684 domain-containing protein [Nakamurella sp. YIM 132087]|uniref:DUF1684 domain-containing protein n=1 Tax=Nakamurella alba TaxID=2665158 RepID=A0A7K1FR62_9ACTN|nr:DUF1684 domain-containing protein [Nakamurella alba]MTD16637.1 DUF1684 domain-containing protein [Nakamurella alba]